MKEIEIKVLNIEPKDIQCRLIENGWSFIEEAIQKIYVYDLPSVRSFSTDLIVFYQSNNMEYEYANLILNEKMTYFTKFLEQCVGKTCETEFAPLFSGTVESKIMYLQSNEFTQKVKEMGINKYRWVRLRQTNDITTVTVKSINNPGKNNYEIQDVDEIEIEVESISKAKELLNAMGMFHRNYQEKRRLIYKKEEQECTIDFWPRLNPFLEIEVKEESLLDEIIKDLQLDESQIVSQNVDEIYMNNGIDIYSYRDLYMS